MPYLPGDHTEKAEALLEHDADWAAPLLWRSQFRNILAGCMRRKTLASEAARDLQLEAESLLAGAEHEVDSRQVLELVRDSDCDLGAQRDFSHLTRRIDGGLHLPSMPQGQWRQIAFQTRPAPSGARREVFLQFSERLCRRK